MGTRSRGAIHGGSDVVEANRHHDVRIRAALLRLREPDALHEADVVRAAGRCPESVSIPGRVALGEPLASARALRAALPMAKFRAKDSDAYKREGRR